MTQSDGYTVFVLGAGASVTYGYPTGPSLKNSLLRTILADRFKGDSRWDTHTFMDLMNRAGLDREAMRQFATDLLESGRLSVDVFLQYSSARRHVGLHAIAAAILMCEDPTQLFAPHDGNKEETSWYQLLVSQLYGSLEEIRQQRVRFVTFNYDRSLDWALEAALHVYTAPQPETEQVARTVESWIHHIHGVVHTQTSGYGGTPTPRDVMQSAENMKLFIERSDDAVLKQVHHIVAYARKIHFVGLSYEPVNLRKLGIPRNKAPKIDISGTCFGMTREQQGTVKRWFADHGAPIRLFDQDASSYFRDHVQL